MVLNKMKLFKASGNFLNSIVKVTNESITFKNVRKPNHLVC